MDTTRGLVSRGSTPRWEEQTVTTTRRRTPEDFGWAAEDLRSAYAVDGSGPYRYAPDGSGPFSYGVDGSGPWLVGPEPAQGIARFAPRQRGAGSRLRRIGTACTAGALALVLAVGSVAAVAHSVPVQHRVDASAAQTADPHGD